MDAEPAQATPEPSDRGATGVVVVSVMGRKGTPFPTSNLWLKAFLHLRLL